MEYTILLKQIIILFIIAALGFFAYRRGMMTEAGNKSVSKIILYITLPAMIIASVADVSPGFSSLDILFFLFVSFISYGVLGLIAFVVPRIIRSNKADYGVYEFLTMFGNVGFMGFPVLSAVFGSQAVFLAAIFNLPMNLLSFTIGVLMLAPKGTKLQAKELFTPAVTASVIAPLLYLAPIEIPAVIYEGCSVLGGATVPLAMMMIGSAIGSLPFKDIWNMPRIYIVAAVKLLVCPVALWFVLRWFVSDPLVLGTAVILGAMPSATNTTLLCIEYNGNEQLASRSVCISTMLSAVTIPLVLFFYFH